ncbi:hypothetical protein B0O99DRAFT_513479 [Bisporella sp. PMI_857]|nr:hypothetical protein B0O99DRAFT_513479 [Bisporella sp. PMI_857]
MSASSTASSSLTRAKVPVAILLAGLSIWGIYYYFKDESESYELPESSGSGLHRSNAVIHRDRSRWLPHDSPQPITQDEDTDPVAHTLTDGETVVDDRPFQDDYPWADPPQEYQRQGQNIVQLLFRVSEDATRRNAYVHRGCACNSCGAVPIRGIRYRCANCADYDLCETCEAQSPHTRTHIFYKVRVPAPTFGPRHIMPVWYTGNPEDPNTHKPLSKALIAKLTRETGFERPELDAQWEQWKFMANVEWREDPDDVNVAMDKKTFERCLVPSGAYRHAAPSLIFDRMFSFYDTNNDKLIGFSEFVHGLAYRKKKNKWKKIFEGYDIDEDGYVDRKDFLRIFRAYYVLYRQMHRDMKEGMVDQAMSSADAHSTINSRKPLSSAFGRTGQYREYDPPDPRTRREGKIATLTGDYEITDSKGIVNESGDDTIRASDRGNILKNYNKMREMGPINSFLSEQYWQAMVDRSTASRSAFNHTSTAGEELSPEWTQNLDLEDSEVLFVPSWDRDEWPPDFVTVTEEDLEASGFGGISLEEVPENYRQEVMMEALRRSHIQYELRKRWRRRQFYTDEEEGAVAPDDWKDEDDVFDSNNNGESSNAESIRKIRSRSSSKVRFVDNLDDFETHSTHSNSSRSIPERWGGLEIPDAERDAGKEILYQVTQEAFNELLDSLFREKEDLAVDASKSKKHRERYRHLYTTPEFEAFAESMEEDARFLPPKSKGLRRSKRQRDSPNPDTSSSLDITQNPVFPDIAEEQVGEMSLDQLLNATGYHVEDPTEEQSHSNREYDLIENEDVTLENGEPQESSDHAYSLNGSPTQHSESSYDPTMPQFRPNSEAKSPTLEESLAKDTEPTRETHNQSSRNDAEERSEAESPPSQKYLLRLRQLDRAEQETEERGGWGKLSFAEFEEAVKGHINAGKAHTVDYLGSWIDFCVP